MNSSAPTGQSLKRSARLQSGGHAPSPTVAVDAEPVAPDLAPLYAEGGYGACYENGFPSKDSVVYWISTEVLEMACEAAHQLAELSPDLGLLPSPAGIFVFERPVTVVHRANTDHGDRNFGRAEMITSVLTWMPMAGSAIVVSSPNWVPGQVEQKKIASLLVDVPALAKRYVPPMVLRLLMALSMILEQREFCDVEQATPAKMPPYAWRKDKAQKARKPSAVRIVRLRPGTDHAAAYGEGTSRQYGHRWIVRGHWRRTVTGTDEAGEPIIKRTWIDPNWETNTGTMTRGRCGTGSDSARF